MTRKKKLITRMALWTGAVLALGLVVGGSALLLQRTHRHRWSEQQRADREQLLGRSRAYLDELAKRIVRLPVDPTVMGEVESRYYEEYPAGPMYVWAMGTNGEMLFGVPREAFARLNAIYDREIVPRLKEGVFIDRQTCFRGLVDQSDEIDPKEFEREAGADRNARWNDWRLRRPEEGTFVLSAPLKAVDGTALGSVYMKRVRAEQAGYRPDGRFEFAANLGGAMAGVALLLSWVLLPTWVYVDARERGVRRAPLFAFLTVISSLIGLVVYLIARPEDTGRLTCPGCGREVNGGAFCPHCGRDLSTAFCSACRYPLKPEGAFCPSCRTEIRRPAAVASTEAPQP